MNAATGSAGKEANIDDSVAQQIADKAHDTIDRVADAATDTEHSIRSAAGRASEHLKNAEDKASLAMEEGMETARSYVQKNPLASAGIAFAAGLLVSVLFRK